MKLQFFNLIHRILEISDWVDFWAAVVRTKILVLYVRFLAWLVYDGMIPIAAICVADDKPGRSYYNATVEMEAFYKYDRTCSVASAHRWLTKFYPGASELYMTCGSRVAHIDLLDDRELMTGLDIIDGDMDLTGIPSVPLVPGYVESDC